MAERAHIALIDVTGGIRFPTLQKAAAALERQIRRDVRKFWDVDADIVAMRHGDELPQDRHGLSGLCPTCATAAASISTRAVHLMQKSVPVRTGRCQRATKSLRWFSIREETCIARAPAIRLHEGQVKNAPGNFSYLMELCDPCENADFAYEIDGVVVSDFYTPHYFDRDAAPRTRYSFTGGITGPRQVPKGGYLCWHNPAIDKMQMLRNLARDPEPRIHTFGRGAPKRRSVREYVDDRLKSMQQLAAASWDHPKFHASR